MAKPHFRAGVVTVVRRSDGSVLAFERVDLPGQWQLPQGGIENGESATEAAWRELGEETGLGPDDVTLVGEHDDLTVYELPSDLRAAERLGQVHRWFFFEPNDERTLAPRPDGREFSDWAWIEVEPLIEQVIGFRRGPYRQVLGG